MSEHEPDNIVELVEQAKHGDRDAIAAIYHLYATRLYRFVRFRVGNPSDAEDIVQRVFLTMIETLPRYQQRGLPLGAWIFRITRNAVTDHHRRHRKDASIDAIQAEPSAAMDPELRAIQSAELLAVERALASLTDEQREVIALRFFAGLSATEVGAVMGKRDGSIRALQFRALASLRRELGWPAADEALTDD